MATTFGFPVVGKVAVACLNLPGGVFFVTGLPFDLFFELSVVTDLRPGVLLGLDFFIAFEAAVVAGLTVEVAPVGLLGLVVVKELLPLVPELALFTFCFCGCTKLKMKT